MKRFIWITTQREGFHSYPAAPDDVKYLRDLHRHMFHFRIEVEVDHDERQIEFHRLKKYVEQYLDRNVWDQNSCEKIAGHLSNVVREYAHTHGQITVEVSEDGENGARVES